MQYKLRTPVTREDLAPLRTGDTVLLSGAVYTARDAAHKRMMELLPSHVLADGTPVTCDRVAVGKATRL